MGVASLVLGIVSFVIGWIPFINVLAFVLSLLGLILGIADVVKKSKNGDPKKGLGIAGIIICAIAVVIFGLYAVVTVGITGLVVDEMTDIIENGEYYFNEGNFLDDLQNYNFDINNIRFLPFESDNLIPQVI